jgi:hypothetical protein
MRLNTLKGIRTRENTALIQVHASSYVATSMLWAKVFLRQCRREPEQTVIALNNEQ